MSAIKIGSKIKEGTAMEQAVKEITPVMWTKLKQAYKGIKDEEGGEFPIYNSKDHVLYRLNARQLAQRTLGPRTEKERVEGIKYEESTNLEQERKAVVSEITNLILKGDDKSVDEAVDLMIKYEILPSNDQLINEIMARNLTKEEQVKIGEKELYQIKREGTTVNEKYD
jgi:hypothetical protein